MSDVGRLLSDAVQWWVVLVWAAAGQVAVELLEWAGAIKRCGGWPWEAPGEPRKGPLIFSIFARVGVAALVGAAFGNSSDVTSVPLAMGVGVAAPAILEKLGKTVREFGPAA